MDRPEYSGPLLHDRLGMRDSILVAAKGSERHAEPSPGTKRNRVIRPQALLEPVESPASIGKRIPRPPCSREADRVRQFRCQRELMIFSYRFAAVRNHIRTCGDDLAHAKLCGMLQAVHSCDEREWMRTPEQFRQAVCCPLRQCESIPRPPKVADRFREPNTILQCIGCLRSEHPLALAKYLPVHRLGLLEPSEPEQGTANPLIQPENERVIRTQTLGCEFRGLASQGQCRGIIARPMGGDDQPQSALRCRLHKETWSSQLTTRRRNASTCGESRVTRGSCGPRKGSSGSAVASSCAAIAAICSRWSASTVRATLSRSTP
jgi:hypothetical protein